MSLWVLCIIRNWDECQGPALRSRRTAQLAAAVFANTHSPRTDVMRSPCSMGRHKFPSMSALSSA